MYPSTDTTACMTTLAIVSAPRLVPTTSTPHRLATQASAGATSLWTAGLDPYRYPE
jgi:hypothetical protein